MTDSNTRKQKALKQFQLGMACYQKDELTKAIEHWQTIQRDDDKVLYAKAQFNLGLTYKKKGDLVKAIEHWKTIQQEDYQEAYAKAQLNLGIVYYEKKDLVKSKKHTKVAVAQEQSDFLKASILLDKIALLQAYSKLNDKNDYTPLKQCLDQIENDVTTVLKSLVIEFKEDEPERKVATYTTVRVAKIFIENRSESFHLNIANRMNDKTEGQSLFKFIGLTEQVDATSPINSFLTSFTFNHNSLNQFRLYGKTDNLEGSGVSFVVSTEMFSPTHTNSNIQLMASPRMAPINSENTVQPDADEQKNRLTERIALYRCIYLNPDNGYMSIARRSRYSFFLEFSDKGEQACDEKYNAYQKDKNTIETTIRTKLAEIKKNYLIIREFVDEHLIKQEIDPLIRKILLPLCYLTKHAAFEEEAECRIFCIRHIDDASVTFKNDRFYVAYGFPLIDTQNNVSYVKNIYLGPKINSMAKMELEYLYRQRNESERLAQPTIKPSDLPLA